MWFVQGGDARLEDIAGDEFAIGWRGRGGCEGWNYGAKDTEDGGAAASIAVADCMGCED